MLFVEGNHFCPACEKTGNCNLQAVAYHLKMTDNHFSHFYENREVDASHPDVMIDHNR
jgi:[NiFe] hydrogenase diaphorase moiety small subunit